MTFEKRGVGVEVNGVPDMLVDDRMVDKLLIHFLRPRNGGGEVRRVIYPTGVPGQALIIFDEPDVASRVLKLRRHELDIWDRKFPVEVNPVDRHELDMPVEATLNTSNISDKELKRLLRQYDFEITSKSRDQVRVKGSMMLLMSLQSETQKLLSSSKTRNSSSSTKLKQSMSPVRVESKNFDHRSPAQAEPLRSIDPHAASHTPASSPTSPSFSDIRPVSRRDPPQSESFIVNPDVMRYALCKREDDINGIRERNKVEISVDDLDAELSNVTVTGHGALLAAGDLRPLLGHLNETLRVRKVDLSGLDSSARAALSQRTHELKQRYPTVLVRQTDAAIHLTGPRQSCDALKGLLLQVVPEGAGPQERTGRAQVQDRVQRRRSSSAPRLHSGTSRREPAGEVREEPASLPYLNGDHRSQRAGNPGGHGAAWTPEVKVPLGRRGPEREETANYGATERTKKTSATGPALKNTLFARWNTEDIKNAFKRHPKKKPNN